MAVERGVAVSASCHCPDARAARGAGRRAGATAMQVSQ